jgi:hypothetical protein
MNPQNSSSQPGPMDGTGKGSGTTETGGTLTEAKTGVTQAARETASKVRSAVSTTAARAREEAARIAAEKKNTAVDRISRYSSAIHDSARELEEKDPNIAWFTHRAADKLQGAADYMRRRDFAGIRYDAEDAARQHPAIFFGGMFLAGLILGNVVKASRRNVQNRYEDDSDYDATRSTADQDSAATPGDLSGAERSAAGI